MEKFKSLTEINAVLTELPRGGFLVDTSEGYIQFGSPPETIKDTMKLPKGVPSVFVLSMEHFDPYLGMSIAEIEFPIYFNFFILKKKTKIYVHQKHIENMKIVLNEALFGPKEINIEDEIKYDGVHDYIPDLKSEMEFFRQGRVLEDMVELCDLNPPGFKINEVIIIQNREGNFFVFDHEKFLTEVPGKIHFQALYHLGETLKEPFIPPEFGITCLGPSHGFDPNQNTSGFILWINKTGIMVDPPANSTLWLKDSNVNPKLIDSIILTHCHADHDSGTFQKILEEQRIKIYTTPTIMTSFLRKYSALTRIPYRILMNMFDFYPIKINEKYNIHGAIFGFYYSLHAIPTIAFYFYYRNKKFIYSSDHLNDPEEIKKLYKKKHITEERMKDLMNFPWHFDIIYHEAGIPPLHTPVSYLNSLDPEIQKKITVYHIAEKDFPENTNLKLAQFGVGKTVYPDIEKHQYEEAYQILNVFSRIDVFKHLPFDKIKDLLLIVKKEKYEKGDFIIQKGTKGDKFFVIISGNVNVSGIGDIHDKFYTTYEYFGEVSILLDQTRKADVIAETTVETYTIESNAFIRLIEGTDVHHNLIKIAETRDEITWSVIRSNPFFKNLSSSQLTHLEKILKPVNIKNGDFLLKENKTMDAIYLLNEGEIEETIAGYTYLHKEKGSMIGSVIELKNDEKSSHSFKAREKSQLYKIKKKEILKFLDENPGIYMRMLIEAGEHV